MSGGGPSGGAGAAQTNMTGGWANAGGRYDNANTGPGGAAGGNTSTGGSRGGMAGGSGAGGPSAR